MLVFSVCAVLALVLPLATIAGARFHLARTLRQLQHDKREQLASLEKEEEGASREVKVQCQDRLEFEYIYIALPSKEYDKQCTDARKRQRDALNRKKGFLDANNPDRLKMTKIAAWLNSSSTLQQIVQLINLID
jgi:hypothetical protein